MVNRAALLRRRLDPSQLGEEQTPACRRPDPFQRGEGVMSGTHFDAEVIKGAFTEERFRHLLEDLGSTKVNAHRANCPVHQGDSPDSLAFHEKGGTVVWACHSGCGGEGGSAIDLVMGVKGIGFDESCNWLGEWLGLSPATSKPKPRAARSEAPAWQEGPPLEAYDDETGRGPEETLSPPPQVAGETRAVRMERIWKALSTSDPQSEEYLKSRGIIPDPNTVRFNLGGTGDEEVDQLARNGFRIAVPMRGPEGEIRSFSFRLARDLSDAEKKAHPARRTKTNMRGDTQGAFYTSETVASWQPRDVLLVAEGMADYLAATSAGYIENAGGGRVQVIGFPGAGPGRRTVNAVGAGAVKGRRIYLALDADPAGEKAAQEAARAIRAAGGIPYRVTLDPIAGKDLCLALQAGNTLSDLIQAAEERGPWDPVPEVPGVPDAPESFPERWERVQLAQECRLRPISSFLPQGPEDVKRIPTGVGPIDRVTRGGLQSGKFIVVVGPPGTGKTTLVYQIAGGLARGGCRVCCLPVDEGPENGVIRLGQALGFDREKLEAGDQAEVEAVTRALEKLPIMVLDPFGPGSTLEDLFQEAARLEGTGPIVFLIDSAQTVTLNGKPGRGLREDVKALTDRIYLEARRTKSIVILTSQANRSSYRSKNPADNSEPLSAASESSALEYRPDMSIVMSGDSSNVTVRIPKNRIGFGDADKVFYLRLDGPRATFHEIDPESIRDAAAEAKEAERRTKLAKVKAEILALLKKEPDGISSEQIIDAVGGRRADVINARKELVIENKIFSETKPGVGGRNVWKMARITPAPVK